MHVLIRQANSEAELINCIWELQFGIAQNHSFLYKCIIQFHKETDILQIIISTKQKFFGEF